MYYTAWAQGVAPVSADAAGGYASSSSTAQNPKSDASPA